MIARASVFQKFGMAKWIIANTHTLKLQWRNGENSSKIEVYLDIKFDVHDFVIVSGFHFIGTDLLLLANDTDD